MHDWLPTTSYALLGLLSFDEELTGYQLQRRAAASLRHFFWSPAMSQIYAELRRLEQLDLVAHRTTPGTRPRRVFRITDAGRQELRRWVADGPGEPLVLKHLTCLRIFYGHMADPGALRARAIEHVRWSEQAAADLRRVRPGVQERSRSDPRWRYADHVIEWGLDYYAAEAASAARLADRLAADPDV